MEVNRILDYSPREIYFHLKLKLNIEPRLKQFDHQFPCVFVLSTGRAGTQTLSELFKLAPNIISYHEPMPTLYRLSNLAYNQLRCWKNCKDIWQESFVTARAALLRRSLCCHKGYVETSPHSTFLAPVIASVIPNVKFIHLVRDPRCVVRSGMRRNWYNGHSFDSTRITPQIKTEEGEKWESYTLFQKNIWLWNETNKWIADFLSTFPRSKQLIVHSEDMFSGNRETVEKIFNFIGGTVPSEGKMSKVLKKKMNAQKKGDFPMSDSWSKQMDSELKARAGTVAMRLGYIL
ncbi:MAG: sulfotransferase [Candidatus Electrothrix sp. YB6]